MERQWPDGPPQELRTRNSVQHGRLSAFAPPSPLAWRCSALRTPFGRVLAPPALRASAVRKAHLRCFLLHWAHRRLLHPQFAMVVLHLRTVPSSAARCFASADFASLCVLEASAASRPPMKAELPCSLGLLRPVSRTARGLRAPHWLRRLFRPHWGLRTGLRFAGPVFRGCGRPLGVSSPLHPFGASTATACFAHCARRSSVPKGARFVRPPATATPSISFR